MKKIISKVGFYIIGAIVGIFLLELFYQVVEIQMPYHELNERCGKMMIPSKRINYFKEGFYLGKSNEYGYLGNPYPPKRDNNNTRIALLGDSFTEGFHLFEDHHFGHVLEQKLLEDNAGKGYEVLNFGIGNYNYNDIIVQYKNYVLDFDPDILVFIIHEEDFYFRDNFFIPSPELKMREDSLVIDYSFTSSPTYNVYQKMSFLMENSCVMKAVNSSVRVMKKDVFKQILFGKLYTPASEQSEFPNSMDRDSEVDIRVFKSFEWFGDRKVFFIFKEDVSSEYMQQYEDYGIICRLAEPVLRTELGDKGIHYRYWDVTNSWGHWNHSAHEVIGEYLYRMIKQDED